MKSTRTRILLSSFIVSGLAVLFSFYWLLDALQLLIAMFVLGCTAGWFARRHGWFSGLLVGFPFAMTQLTRLARPDYPAWGNLFIDPDYWRLLLPVAIVSTGLAIMGAMAGAWMQDMKLQREK